MMDEPLLDRYTLQWQDLGFQGKDPGTDFRAMGLLALDDLSYLSKYHNVLAKQILGSSLSPAFAIVSISITAYCLRLLRARQLQFLLYKHGVTKEVYHEIYSTCFGNSSSNTASFYKFWNNSMKLLTVADN
jgi:ELMO/CED-12 family